MTHTMACAAVTHAPSLIAQKVDMILCCMNIELDPTSFVIGIFAFRRDAIIVSDSS